MTLSPSHIIPVNFEQVYLRLRQKEKRVYSDEELLQLPKIGSDHPHHKEWAMRQQSCKRLVTYFNNKRRPLHILEIGCGNGWLSRQLATIPDSKVIGSDINFTELEQAARVFSKVNNLHFIYSDIESGVFEEEQFDTIIFGACIQYFASLPGIIDQTLKLLKPGGEIHILDSPFYEPAEAIAAKQRSKMYYDEIDFPEMASHYFHHSLNDLEKFPYKVFYQPLAINRYFFKPANPFHWICIKKPNENS